MSRPRFNSANSRIGAASNFLAVPGIGGGGTGGGPGGGTGGGVGEGDSTVLAGRAVVTDGLDSVEASALVAVVAFLQPGDDCTLLIALDNHRCFVIAAHLEGQAVVLGFERGESVEVPLVLALVVPLYRGSELNLDGDGGFCLQLPASRRIYQFRPSSVRSLWTAVQAVLKRLESAEAPPKDDQPAWAWLAAYTVAVAPPVDSASGWSSLRAEGRSDLELIREKAKEQVAPPTHGARKALPDEVFTKELKRKLKELMFACDLDTITSKQVRKRLEEHFGADLSTYTNWVNEQMIVIMGQMDAASKIFDHLFLGTEWNASNLDELEANNCRYILNVTKEIGNFYEDRGFKYHNVRLWDTPSENLLPHWEQTFRFIRDAKRHSSCVLVHCKMGVSRSASTVIAYAMKQHNWSLSEAHAYVFKRRPIVKPNEGFKNQLVVYEGILRAKRDSGSWGERLSTKYTFNSPAQPIVTVSPPGTPNPSPPGSPHRSRHDHRAALVRNASHSDGDGDDTSNSSFGSEGDDEEGRFRVPSLRSKPLSSENPARACAVHGGTHSAGDSPGSAAGAVGNSVRYRNASDYLPSAVHSTAPSRPTPFPPSDASVAPENAATVSALVGNTTIATKAAADTTGLLAGDAGRFLPPPRRWSLGKAGLAASPVVEPSVAAIIGGGDGAVPEDTCAPALMRRSSSSASALQRPRPLSLQDAVLSAPQLEQDNVEGTTRTGRPVSLLGVSLSDLDGSLAFSSGAKVRDTVSPSAWLLAKSLPPLSVAVSATSPPTPPSVSALSATLPKPRHGSLGRSGGQRAPIVGDGSPLATVVLPESPVVALMSGAAAADAEAGPVVPPMLTLPAASALDLLMSRMAALEAAVHHLQAQAAQHAAAVLLQPPPALLQSVQLSSGVAASEVALWDTARVHTWALARDDLGAGAASLVATHHLIGRDLLDLKHADLASMGVTTLAGQKAWLRAIAATTTSAITIATTSTPAPPPPPLVEDTH